MLNLIYVSTALRAFSDADLVALLNQSREKNTRLGITGMLLYKDLSFIQLLEGPDEAVRGLVSTINRDNRHTGILILLDRQIQQRRCPNWSMGFQNLNDPALQSLPGYSEFMNESLDSERYQTDPNHAIRLLELFRKNMTA